MKRYFFLHAFILLLAAISATVKAQQSEDFSSATTIRSTFLMHIVNYSRYDKDNTQSSAIPFCFLEQQSTTYYQTIFDKGLSRSTLHPIEIVQVVDADDALNKQCRYLFVDEQSETDLFISQMPQLNKTMVTIGETRNFIKSGGLMSLVEQVDKIKIVISKDVYETSPVKFSALLLKHANFTG